MINFFKKFPPQIKYIVGNEAAERYSYYGMRSILTVFMISQLRMVEGHAVSVYHLFAAGCYLLPLFGGYLADRFLGKYKTIMLLSIVYCLGHAVLALYDTELGTYWGLGLIALGAGGIKPCVSAHVGDQFKPNEKDRMQKVFELFYWMINFGSTIATIITPLTFKAYGSQVAFGIPGVLMLLATIIFWMGRKYYVHVPPTGSNPHSFMKILWSGVKGKAGGFWKSATAAHSQQHVDGVKAVLSIMLLYVWISVFWCLYDQSGSTWILQGAKMKPDFFGIPCDESQIQALNPMMIMAMIPLFSLWIFPMVQKMGVKITPVRKMIFGMFLTAVGYASVALIQHAVESGAQLTIAWQFVPYLIMAIAELLISITGLEFAYTQAPRAMKSTVMSIWLLTVFIGNMLTAWISKIDIFPMGSSSYFWFYTGLMAATAIVFAFFASRYKMRDFMEA